MTWNGLTKRILHFGLIVSEGNNTIVLKIRKRGSRVAVCSMRSPTTVDTTPSNGWTHHKNGGDPTPLPGWTHQKNPLAWHQSPRTPTSMRPSGRTWSHKTRTAGTSSTETSHENSAQRSSGAIQIRTSS